jgi:DeoR family fructose operon transcriptional repressor
VTAGGEHAFGEERRERIVAVVNARGRVRIGELAREVAASEPTVRKDLALLERAGLLRRTHGGALALRPPAERSFSDRLGREAEAKTAIARACIDLVADGDAVFIDSGTTTLRIAELLTARNVNALTNGIAVAAALAEKPTVRHTLVGGVLRPAAGALAGALAVENVARFSVSTAFIGVTGLTAEGITVADFNEAQLKAAVLARSRRVVVPMDVSKLGINDFALVAPLEAVHMVVTVDPPPELVELCADHGVTLVDADKEP